jgi:hypothetical protein
MQEEDNFNNRVVELRKGGATIMDWSKFQGNKGLQRQISKRIEYLKV